MMDTDTFLQGLLEFIVGKFWNAVVILFMFAFILMLVGQIPFVGKGIRDAVAGAAKGVAELAGKGIGAALGVALKFAINLVATTLAITFWGVICGFIYAWYLFRCWRVSGTRTPRPPQPCYPASPGWINLFPAKKKRGNGHDRSGGGGHHGH